MAPPSPPPGLSSAEAARRLESVGPNALVVHRRRALAVQFLLRFRNPLVLLLLGASAVSAATGELRGALIIIGIVALSVTLDFAQEHRADRAAERLQEAARVKATVLRDGVPRELSTEEVVPGDVVLLTAGDLVPADGVLLEGRDLFVNQALLTGEPYPVERHPLPPDTPPGRAGDEQRVFMGTSVLTGSGRAVITGTGTRTELGRIGKALTRRPPPTAFELGTRSFGLMIVRLATLMVLFVILVDLIRGRPWLESFLFAVALAVGLTPELLPMVVSVTLARGALRLAEKKVLVKRLSAIHDLGSMDVLCTDKTGTLTEARIRLERHEDPQGRDSARVLELAFLNSTFESGLKSPLDEAILRHAEVDVRGWEKVDEVPFDFERRRVSVLLRRGEERRLIVKGAPEDVIGLCAFYEDDGQTAPLEPARRAALLARFEALGREGFRVLGIAWKAEPPEREHAIVSDEAALVFAGFAAFEDPPRPGVGDTLRALEEAGVSLVLITGDNERVAEHVSRAVGLPFQRVLTGDQVRALDDHALETAAEGTQLFCRMNPAEKNRVIRALKRRGHVVGYLGDGINDAPSLHAADVGISVDGAADVAREAADLILLQHALSVVHDGVLEGRRTLGNILKYILMGTSSNFGNMFSMAGAALLLPFLPMLPSQILLNNFLYDLSEIPIPTDQVDPAFAARPHRWDLAGIRRFMIFIGPISSVFDYATFGLLWWMFQGDEAHFHTGWFVESLATQVLVIFVIRTAGNPLRSRPSRPLALTSIAVVGVALLLPYTPLAGPLRFVPLPPGWMLLLVPLVASYLLAVQAAKRWFYRHLGFDRPPAGRQSTGKPAAVR